MLSPRPPTWASRETRESGNAHLPEDKAELLDVVDGLIKLETASPTLALKWLTYLSSLSDAHRQRLLTTARSAVETAYIAYDRVRSSGCEKMPDDMIFRRMSLIFFDKVRDFKKYVFAVDTEAGDLEDSTRGFGFFKAAALDWTSALDSVRKAASKAESGSAKVEMAEIVWAVERKCMYWAAVDMMRARIKEAGHAEGSGRDGKSSSEASEVSDNSVA